MNILITNDDGIGGYGIAVLTQTFARAGTVYVAAPAQNQSGVGHADAAPRGLYASQSGHACPLAADQAQTADCLTSPDAP